MVMFTPVLSPHGALMLVRSSETEDALVLEVERSVRLEKAFARGSGHGLLVLGADEVGTTLSPGMTRRFRSPAHRGAILSEMAGSARP
jgi:hypothetical protein